MIIDALAHAIQYAQLGFKVFPCHSCISGVCTCGRLDCSSVGKHPLTPHGVKDATTDADAIRAWWERWPFANIAIATGFGKWVLDVDPKHGGLATLADLEAQHGALPQTLTARTGSDGRHNWFRGEGVRNAVGVCPGIDVRGEGGYVIVPPSLHKSANAYAWMTPLDTPVAEPPAWLLVLLPSFREGNAQSQGEARPDLTPSRLSTPTLTFSEGIGFAEHPGAEQGKRQDTLMRLLGIALSKGENVSSIQSEALAWAKRCAPPYPEQEVMRRLSALLSKRLSKGECVCLSERLSANANEGVDSQEGAGSGQGLAWKEGSGGSDAVLPSFPTIHTDALTGLPGAIVQAVAPETEADATGILLSLLVCFGNAVGKGAWFRVGIERHYGNLFLAVEGDTASGKGQTFSIGHGLLSLADAEWASTCVAYGLASGEGLVDRLRDADADEGEALTLAMPSVKRLLCYESEFARPVTAMRREGNTLSPILRAAWDGQTLEVNTRGKSRLRASNAHVSVIAHVTPEETAKLLSGSVEVANGFANRFLWARVKRSRLLPHGGNASVIDGFAAPLADALAFAKSAGEVKRTADADALWEGVYADLAKARRGAFGKATERARPQVMRLALLYALLDKSKVVDTVHLRAALALWRYCEASASVIFVEGGDSPEGQGVTLAAKALATISASPGIARAELLRSLRCPADDLSDALAWLHGRGMAYPEQRETAGRYAECWYPGRKEVNPGDADADALVSGDTFTSFLPPTPTPENQPLLPSCQPTPSPPAAAAVLLSTPTPTPEVTPMFTPNADAHAEAEADPDAHAEAKPTQMPAPSLPPGFRVVVNDFGIAELVHPRR